MSKYTPLEKYLNYSKTYNKVINMSFNEIEKIIGEQLPESAYKYAAWWANEKHGSHSHAKAWMRAGWKVDGVDFKNKHVQFTIMDIAPRVRKKF